MIEFSYYFTFIEIDMKIMIKDVSKVIYIISNTKHGVGICPKYLKFWKVIFRVTPFRKIMHNKSVFNVHSVCA